MQSLCLEWAVPARIDHRVWGGLSEDERRTVKHRSIRRRRASRHWRDVAGASTSQQLCRIEVGFDAGGDGVAMERGTGLIGVVSLVDEHPDRPVDRRHVV